MMTTWKKTWSILVQFPYNIICLFFIFSYISFDIWINETLIVLPGLLHYPLYISVPFFVTHTIVPILFAISITLFFWKLYTLKQMSAAGGTASFAAFIGLLSGACPGCIAGLLPAFMGLFGYAAFTVNALPFYGNELQVFSIVLFLISIYYLVKDPLCIIKKFQK